MLTRMSMCVWMCVGVHAHQDVGVCVDVFRCTCSLGC